MNIFLMGFMGSGKSTSGKVLAKKLNMAFVDLDELIENAEQTSIDSIFEAQGEEKFRELELNYLKKSFSFQNTVTALGGGTPCYHDNIKSIKKNGISVYLKMPAAAIVNRLSNAKTSRPLIKNKTQDELAAYIKKTLGEREKYYEQANYTINALNLNIDELITNIKGLIPSNK